MNAKQIAKLVSFVTSEAILKNNAEAATVAEVPEIVTQLGSTLAEIQKAADTQKQLTEGRTAVRKEVFDDMRESALVLAKAVMAHALKNKLPGLIEEASVTPTQFERLRLPERPSLARRILAVATATLPTHPELAELAQHIEAADEALSQPREVLAERRAATQRLETLFADAEGLLRRIDLLLYPLRRTGAAGFHAKYHASRKAYGISSAGDTTAAPTEAAAGPVASTQNGTTTVNGTTTQTHALAA